MKKTGRHKIDQRFQRSTTMSNATLIGQEFDNLAEKFAKFSEEHHLSWNFKQVPSGLPYLVFKQVLGRTNNREDALLPEGVQEEEEEECDQATVMTEVVDAVNMEYHVIYSESYQVPVLYFNAFHSDGKLLTLEEIWASVPGLYQQRIEYDRWTVLTQQEHPILGRPFFQLHPCNTAKLMEQALTGAQSCGNYIVTWLSSVGPLVGLHLPLVFSQLCKNR